MWLTLIATTVVANAEPVNWPQTFERRARLLAEDAVCELLSDDERRALQSGLETARGVLLRAGAVPHKVDALERAQSTEPPDCRAVRGSERLSEFRDAFTGWSRMAAMDFPGLERTWRATRPQAGAGKWLATQKVADGDDPARFGFVSHEGKIWLAVALPDMPDAKRAYMEVRDPAKATGLLDETMAALLIRDMHPLARRAQPEAYARKVFAAGRFTAGAAADFFWDHTNGAVFLFPASATDALQPLLPTEAFRVVIESPARTQTLYFEVGDWKAARLFIGAIDDDTVEGIGRVF